MQAIGTAPMSAADWNKQLANNATDAQRQQQAKAQAQALGQSTYNWTGVDGSSGFGSLVPQDNGSGSTPSAASTDTGTGLDTADMMNQAKDLANFNLGIYQQQGDLEAGWRSNEATQQFGFNTALQGQQIKGQQSLEYMKDSTQKQMQQADITNQQTQQQKQFDQDNLFRANSAALAMQGFKGY